jgi:hypothetical protein
VAPLIRWSVRSTRHIRLEDRLSHIAAALPASLIGAHAISHLRYVDDLVAEHPHRRYYAYPYAPAVCSRDELHDACRRALETGGHGELNAILKAHGLFSLPAPR